jgi:cob(I)alamin adenosyltransferase
MKIYTKAGDKGMTSLLNGLIVSKDHPRLEAYGTLDELNSWIGLLRDHIDEASTREDLLRIQDRLMAGSSLLASEKPEQAAKLPKLNEEDVKFLESRIDSMDAELSTLTSFILPGGHTLVSYCHLARTTCRRAERNAIRFRDDSEQAGLLLKFLNRLSDYLFVLARKISKDFKVEEITWQP